MNRIETLTEEQETLMDTLAESAIQEVLGTGPVDLDAVRPWLDTVYGMYDKKAPARVEVVGSPFAAFALEAELTGSTEKHLDWCGASDAGWVSFYDYMARIGALSPEDPEHKPVMELRAYMRCVWDSVLLDECAILIARPRVATDQNGDLHCATGPALVWQSGEVEYAWHGIWVPERTVMAPRSYSRDEYLAITDTEQRRAIGEAAGWAHVVGLIGAREEDAWTDPSTGLAYALFSSEDGAQWLRKQSPVLQTGASPVYFEPVHEELRTARAARKWQATDLTPDQCEKDPILKYGTET